MFRGSKYSYLALLILLPFLSGCTSTIVSMMKKQPAFNWTYIPHELKEGDGSTYRSLDGTQSWRYEITDIIDGDYRMQMYWLTADDSVSFLKGLRYHFVVGKNGYVKAAYLQDGEGNMNPLRLAEPGEYGYVDKPHPIALQKPEWIETPLGRYEVKKILVYNNISSSPVGGTIELTTVGFLSDEVPFGYVMQQNTASVNLPLSNVLEYASMLTPIDGVYKTLGSYFLSLVENHTATAGNVIVSNK